MKENLTPNQTLKVVKLRKYDIKVKASGSTVMAQMENRTPKPTRKREESEQLDHTPTPAKKRANDNLTPPPPPEKVRPDEAVESTDDFAFDFDLNDLPNLSPSALVDINFELAGMDDISNDFFDGLDGAQSKESEKPESIQTVENQVPHVAVQADSLSLLPR